MLIEEMEDTKTVRLNKYLADLGVAARRKIPEVLGQGRVKVNGVVAAGPGQRINPDRDEVLLDNKKLSAPQKIYLALNKPFGIVSTTSDELGRATIASLVPRKTRLYPVGRLDKDSTGLIILTNDGQLSNLLSHPRHHLPKTYEVGVTGCAGEYQLQKLREGIELKEGRTAPAKVQVTANLPKRTTLEITIWEGRNRQIRRMCGKVGLTVVSLKRLSIGPVKLGYLKAGQWRELSQAEVEALIVGYRV